MPPNTRINAGEFRHRIKICDLLNKQGGLGGISSSEYSTFLETWASVNIITGTERYQASQTVSVVTYKVKMRYAEGISSRQIVLFDNKYFSIQSVDDPDGRHKMLELTCVETGDSARDVAGGAA